MKIISVVLFLVLEFSQNPHVFLQCFAIGWNLTFLQLHFGQVFCKSLHSDFLGAGFGTGRRCFFKLVRNSLILRSEVFHEIKINFSL